MIEAIALPRPFRDAAGLAMCELAWCIYWGDRLAEMEAVEVLPAPGGVTLDDASDDAGGAGEAERDQGRGGEAQLVPSQTITAAKKPITAANVAATTRARASQ